MDRRTFLKAGAGVAATSGFAAPALSQGAAARTLRFVPQANLANFDPIWGTQYVVRNAACMVWDTLYGFDANLTPQRQMVESEEVTDGGRTWTFKLRAGLRFHDGEPVRARDVAASLNRWAVRDGMGQMIRAIQEEPVSAVDDTTFRWRLKSPYPKMLVALGKNNTPMSFIMPERIARTDPFQQITEIVGSGPYRFVAAEYRPGSRLVYERNPDYVPRPEPASGFAGGKRVHVDRVEWVIIPDPPTAFAALRRGEVDFIDAPLLDMLPTITGDPDIVIGEVWPIETYGVLRFNHLHPPFNNVLARRAVAHAVSQRDYMAAAYGDEKWWRECYAFWICGSPNGTEAGSEPYRRQDLDRARQLVEQSGQKGAKVVLIGGNGIPAYRQMSLVTADILKRIGFVVDMQLSDWGSVAARRAKKDPPDQGGWNVFHTSANGAQLASPLTSPSTIMTCDGRNFVGWPCDEESEAMRQRYIREANTEAQRALLERMHRRLWEQLPYVPLGQFRQPFLWRRNVTGVVRANTLVFWNIDKA